MNALEIRALRKRFGPVQVLDDITLNVPEGSTTAILGPSGCGKTTLLRLIAGFDHPDTGTITFGGTTVVAGRRSLAPNRRDIGYVAQEGALFPHLRVEANVGFGLVRSGLTTAARRRRVADLLALVHLDTALSRRYPHELSGGQQQRVALARALARRPALVLLDEPFSSLDTTLREATRTAVAQALRAERVTTVLVTHDRSEALSMADQVAVLTHGTFRQVGPVRDVYARPADLDTAHLLGPGSTVTGTIVGSTVQCGLGVLPTVRTDREGQAVVFLRPDQLVLSAAGRGESGGARATVQSVGFHGADTVVTVWLPDAAVLTARVVGDTDLRPGDLVDVNVRGPVQTYPASSFDETERRGRLVGGTADLTGSPA